MTLEKVRLAQKAVIPHDNSGFLRRVCAKPKTAKVLNRASYIINRFKGESDLFCNVGYATRVFFLNYSRFNEKFVRREREFRTKFEPI